MNCKSCDNGLEPLEEQFEQCFECQKKEEGPQCYICDKYIPDHDEFEARRCLHDVMVQS